MTRRTALAIVTAAVLGVAGCGQFDETGSFAVANDQSTPIVIYQCGNTCGQRHETVRLQPGGRTEFNATVGGPAEYVLVADAASHRLGCLTMLIRRLSRTEPVVLTSHVTPCSKKVLGPGSRWDRTFG